VDDGVVVKHLLPWSRIDKVSCFLTGNFI